MKSNNFLTSVIVLSFFLTCSRTALTNDEKIDIPAFKKAAVKKWTEMFNAANKYECTRTTRTIEEGKIVNEDVYKSGVLFPCNYLEREEEFHSDFSVVCNNSKYHFTLNKKSKDPDAEWEISYVRNYSNKIGKNDWYMRYSGELTDENEEGAVYYYTPEEKERGLSSMESLSSIWGRLNSLYPLSCMFTDPDVIVSSVEETVTESGVPCYSVEFTYKPNSKHNLFNIRDMKMELDKSNYALLHIVYRWGSDNYESFIDRTITYANPNDAGFPLVKKAVTRDIENGKLRHIKETEYEYKLAPDLTEDRFKLSYYGFPEPIFDDDSKLDSRWYFLLAGLGFITVATFLGRFRKRKSQDNVKSDENAA